MGLVASSLGVPEERIIYENRSYNTFTNAIETKKILDKKGISKIILGGCPRMESNHKIWWGRAS